MCGNREEKNKEREREREREREMSDLKEKMYFNGSIVN